WKRKLSVHIEDADAVQTLIGALDAVLRVARIKAGGKALGFICLYTDGHGSYWFKAVRSFSGALQESIASLESLIDDTIGLASDAQKERISTVYRRLTELFQIE
ncbi:MAG TPA: ATP-dependent RNA helicase, partial [Candidatus Treponema faecavium]|nr:ATP-dependent RNA helicase [Candidatus Treponema faecavium]